MTGSLAGTLPAVGAAHAAWLLLAFPAFGAAVLLLGGKRTNAWGHWLGVTMSLASFGYGVVLFVQMLGRPASAAWMTTSSPGFLGLAGSSCRSESRSIRCRFASCC